VVDAVAGVGGSTTDNDPGTLLVTGGVNTGSTARVQPLVRNPRTAAGVSEDGGTLILAVIDGRQPGWSDGVTLPELAALMIQHGAHNAINLDGGGSSRSSTTTAETTAREPPQRRGAPRGREPPGCPHQPESRA
jgi:exopolysaccharide biosynthesis protein